MKWILKSCVPNYCVYWNCQWQYRRSRTKYRAHVLKSRNHFLVSSVLSNTTQVHQKTQWKLKSPKVTSTNPNQSLETMSSIMSNASQIYQKCRWQLKSARVSRGNPKKLQNVGTIICCPRFCRMCKRNQPESENLGTDMGALCS